MEMPRLKAVFEKQGCQDVVTYINSGNVIFSDTRAADELEPLLEKAIAAEFGLAVPVVLRDQANIAKLCREIPEAWTNDSQLKTDVMFLWKEINGPDILQKVVIKPDIEKVIYIYGALVWNIGRQNVARGGGLKLIKTELYKQMTVRNINTVRKLNQLMDAVNN